MKSPARSIPGSAPRARTSARVRARRAFTLVELLVAISIIAILVAIVAVVGLGAFQNQRAAAAKGLLSTLDRALEEYRLVKGSFPKFNPVDYVHRPGPAWNVAVPSGTPDAGNTTTTGEAFGTDPRAPTSLRFPKKPSAGVAFRQMRGVAECEAVLSALPPDFFFSTPRPLVSIAPNPAQPAEDDAVTILDPWSISASNWEQHRSGSTPAYPAVLQSYVVYVHPENLLAQSLYGECVNGRPYFLIAGPDAKLGLKEEFPSDQFTGAELRPLVEGALKDNITSYPVGAPNLTDEFWTTYR